MRTLFPLFLVSFFLLAATAMSAAQSPLYDFGTMQQGKTVQAEPGETVNLTLFFYVDEVYGNRITHVLLSVQNAPSGWPIEFNPPAHDEYLNVSGIMTTSHENVFVTPLPLLPEPPAVPTPGMEYLRSPSGKGFLQARRVQAIVRIPKDAALGQTYPVKILGEAFWFGQSGNIALKQTRSFEFQINTAKKEYTEQVVAAPPAKSNATNASANAASGAGAAAGEFPYLYAIGALALLAIIFAAYKFFKKK
jgi:hypothetical protein